MPAYPYMRPPIEVAALFGADAEHDLESSVQDFTRHRCDCEWCLRFGGELG